MSRRILINLMGLIIICRGCVLYAGELLKQPSQFKGAGYILIIPENNEPEKDELFILSYLDSYGSKLTQIGAWKLFDSFNGNYPSWLRVDRKNKVLLFAVNYFKYKVAKLYFLSLEDGKITARSITVPVQAIFSGWNLENNRKVVIRSWQGEGYKPKHEILDMLNNTITPLKDDDIPLAPAFGALNNWRPYGGPYLMWKPTEKSLYSRYFEYQPSLPSLPSTNLSENRIKDKWIFYGYLKESFVLISNPTYAQTRNDIKTKAGCYLARKKEWKIFDLDGTQCFVCFMGDWLVFQQNELNPKSRPEENFSYPSIPTGKYKFFNSQDCREFDLILDKNSTILAIDESEILVREGNCIFRLLYDEKGNINQKIKLCEGGMVGSVQYAIPVSQMPTVEEAKDFGLEGLEEKYLKEKANEKLKENSKTDVNAAKVMKSGSN